jgi:hypothetical protein
VCSEGSRPILAHTCTRQAEHPVQESSAPPEPTPAPAVLRFERHALHRPIIAPELGCEPPTARYEVRLLVLVTWWGVCRRSDWSLLCTCVRDKQRSGGSLCRAHVGRRLRPYGLCLTS